MSETTIPYETIEEFYEAIKKHVPEIMKYYSKEEKVKRTITVPRVFDTVFHGVIRGNMLRLHDTEINYNDLLVGFAMIGLARWASESVITKLGDDADFLNAYNEVRKREEGDNHE
jgi:hypothetical protein